MWRDNSDRLQHRTDIQMQSMSLQNVSFTRRDYGQIFNLDIIIKILTEIQNFSLVPRDYSFLTSASAQSLHDL